MGWCKTAFQNIDSTVNWSQAELRYHYADRLSHRENCRADDHDWWPWWPGYSPIPQFHQGRRQNLPKNTNRGLGKAEWNVSLFSQPHQERLYSENNTKADPEGIDVLVVPTDTCKLEGPAKQKARPEYRQDADAEKFSNRSPDKFQQCRQPRLRMIECGTPYRRG